MARLFSAIKALKAYIAQFGRRKRLSLRRKERIGDSRRIARADEVHQPQGRRFRERRDRADAAEAGAGPRVKVFRTGPCARICGWMRDLTPKEGSLAERGCAEVPPTRHVQPWAVPAPTPNAPLRKEVEREMDAPEGNLVIVERCIHERQHHFSCREYGWVGSAHRFGAGTEYEWKGRIEKWVNSRIQVGLTGIIHVAILQAIKASPDNEWSHAQWQPHLHPTRSRPSILQDP